ncbi:MAG: shikimate dehydrogenase [Verrucomicrobiota bacterium]
MRDVYRTNELNELKGMENLYGVIGCPVAHSLSPAMQLAGFQSLGIDAQYVRVEIQPEELPDAIQTMRELPFQGWNCTLPHKLELARLVDQLGESTRRLGGVNTVIHENGQLTGFNTDGEGWMRAVREVFSLDVRDLRILILGTGGAGQALARQVASEGCERLVLANRSVEKAERLAGELKPHFISDKLLGSHDRLRVIPLDDAALEPELEAIDLIVNGTSLGLKATDPPVLHDRLLQPHLCIYDTIYRKTRLQEAAIAAGARVSNGLSMLLHQGALSLELWTEQNAPVEVMRDALTKAAA